MRFPHGFVTFSPSERGLYRRPDAVSVWFGRAWLNPSGSNQNNIRSAAGTPLDSGRFRRAPLRFRKKRSADQYCCLDCQNLYAVCHSRRRLLSLLLAIGAGYYAAQQFLHQYRHQQADFARPRLAQARQPVRACLRPGKTDPGGRRGADAGALQRRGQGAGCKTVGRHREFRIGAAARLRRVLREERVVVPAGGRGRQGHRPARSGRAPDRDHGRRSLDPRPDRRAGDRTCRRQARSGQARQHRTPLQPDQPDGRERPEQGDGDLLLARTRQRQAFDRCRPARLHRVQAEARLQRARTRQGRHRRDPAGRDRPQFRRPVQRARPADRPGSDRQRGICDRAGRRDRQRHRHRRHRAGDSLDGAAFGARSSSRCS